MKRFVSLACLGLWAAFHWPILTTLCWTLKVYTDATIGTTFLCVMVDAIWFDAALRVSRIVSIFLHELAHVALFSLFLVLQPGTCDLVTLVGRVVHAADMCRRVRVGEGAGASAEIRQTRVKQMIRMLLPHLKPWAASPSMHIQLPRPCTSQFEQVVVQAGGLVCSLLLPLLFMWQDLVLVERTASITWWACLSGTLLATAGALLSDLPSGPLLGLLPPMGCFCCGNWGCLVPRDHLGDDGNTRSSELMPWVCCQLLTKMLDIVDLRGAQAGGVTMFSGEGSGVVAFRTRVVKSKRGHLATMIFRKLRWNLRWNFLNCSRRRRPLPVVLAQGHSRFGTSSAPNLQETHPHQWCGMQWEVVWTRDLDTGRWSRKRTQVCVTITHNGDFNGFKVYDEVVPNQQLGEWLRRILYHNNPACGDSPKLAGMMDLLVTHGMWKSAVRLAFVQTVMHHVEEASGWERLEPGSPNTVPAPFIFASWARIFDERFQVIVAQDIAFEPSEESICKLAYDACSGLQAEMRMPTSEIRDAMLLFGMSGDVLSNFCVTACRAFFNDLLGSIQYFFTRSEGSFGISVSCSLWPDKIVLAAKGQPISLAFDPDRPLAMWSSEPASLAIVWPTTRARPRAAATSRIDMDDAVGEAIELRMTHRRFCTDDLNLNHLAGTLAANAEYFLLPSAGNLSHYIMIRGLSLTHAMEPLTKEDFFKRIVSFRCSQAQPLELSPTSMQSSVSKDLADVPSVLVEIDDSWDDRYSLNRLSARKFSEDLGRLVKAREAKGHQIDVLVFGVENSLWLGQQFAADLARIFPRLNVVAASSNIVLGMFQQRHGHMEPMNWAISRRNFQLSPGAIAFGISQSGTTYPTVWAARLLTCLQQQPQLYALSGDFDTVLAGSIGQSLQDCTFSNNLFSTLSGVRPAEPSTVATIAMHHTLTRLLIYLPRHLQQSGLLPDRTENELQESSTIDPGGTIPMCELRVAEATELNKLATSMASSAEEIVGNTEVGLRFESPVNKDLRRVAATLSSHLQEGWWAVMISSTYVLVTVTLGFPVISGVWALSVDHIMGEQTRQQEPLFIGLGYAVSAMDALLYIFMPMLATTAHRLLTKRRLWTRHASRTLVFLDSTVNYKLLRAYVSKLRSLSWRLTSFGVMGQNPADHFVHEMTHLAHSDVVLLVGRPDGRLANLTAMESSIIMSVQQARFISSSASGGVEAISVGHNPWQRPGLFHHAVALPTRQRPLFYSQKLMRTNEGGHAPSALMHRVAELASDAAEVDTGRAAEESVWIDLPTLIARLGNLREASRDAAIKLVTTLLCEQQERLGIDATKIDVEALFNACGLRATTTHVPDGTSSGTSSHFSKGVSLLSKMTFSTVLRPLKSDAVSVNKLMALLRGRTMRVQIALLRKAELRAIAVRARVARRWFLFFGNCSLSSVFAAWLEIHEQESEERRRKEAEKYEDETGQEKKSVASPSKKYAVASPWKKYAVASPSKKSVTSSTASWEDELEAPNGQWRKLEEIRRNGMKIIKIFGFSCRKCFKEWKNFARAQAAARGTLRPVAAERMVVGSELPGSVLQGGGLLAEFSLVESLYETRIAAAERLLSFFVMLHHAVEPSSRLPLWQYPMDRSQSRLRVASTPAPVGFVETLSKQPAGMDGRTTEDIDEFLAMLDTV